MKWNEKYVHFYKSLLIKQWVILSPTDYILSFTGGGYLPTCPEIEFVESGESTCCRKYTEIDIKVSLT